MGSSADAGHIVETFPVPAGVRPGWPELIADAHQCAQDAVDQLGAGHPEKAPNFAELLQNNGLAKVNAGKTVMAADYETKHSSLDKIKSTLAGQDVIVGDSAFQAGTIPGNAWSDIENRVSKLVTTLKSTPAPSPGQKYLSPDIQATVGDALIDALDDISAIIEKAHEQMVSLAVSLSAPGATPASIDSKLASAGSTPWSKGAAAVELTGGQKATAQEIYQYLINKYHLTPAQAAGVVGNMMVESSLDTGAFNSGEGAFGLCQWEGGRLTDLQQYAASQKQSPSKWQVQVDFMMKEMGGSESGAYSQLRAASNPADAASAFAQHYERCQAAPDPKNPYPERVNAANTIAKQMSAVSL
ncbi:hypothetical protein ABIA39_006274 [Nocardia sp. GAS34]|uniref:phage tail tip lysozyme n=1 Tax=unclassified Nocardia TaxID=2637762 RepID=UPI003D19A373